jgi:hypothetical protein
MRVETAETDSGKRGGVPTEVADKVKLLDREVRELRQAKEIPHEASAHFTHASSTARSGDDRFHWRSPRCLWVEAICRHWDRKQTVLTMQLEGQGIKVIGLYVSAVDTR